MRFSVKNFFFSFFNKIANFYYFQMSSENQAVEAALEKHEKDKQTKNLITYDVNEVQLRIEICNHISLLI